MGLLSDILSGGPGSGSADAKYQEAIKAISNVYVPTLEEQKVELERLVEAGVLTPEEMQTFLQEPSAMAELQADPRFREAQTNALAKLQDIVEQGGLTATDRARIQDIIDAQNVEERGAREAIAQNARERGIGGSDFELVSKMVSQQGSANRAARQGMDVAALAEQRALDALKGSADLGSRLETQQFGQEAEKAKAQDIINQFNTANRQNVQQANVGARNMAQATNLANRQNISNLNVSNLNAEKLRRAQLIQDKFKNEMAKAQGIAGVYGQWAPAEQAQENAQFANQMGLISTGLQAAASAFGAPPGGASPGVSSIGGGKTTNAAYNNPYMLPSDVMNKEDISPADVELDDFMMTLQPYKYKYKDRSMGEGEHAGVMANDMAKTPMGAKIVVKTPEGLAIDTKKGFGVLAAAIGRLNKKMEEKDANRL